MPWFRVDDGFWSHPKTLQLSDGAQALWMRAGSWSMHHLTDGVIPAYALPLLRAKPRFVNELVAVSLWFSDEDAYRFHDWNRYQPTREQVEADRDAAADRKRRSREKSRRDKGGTDGRSSADAAVTPSQPIPTHPTSTSNEVEEDRPRKRGSRLESDWVPERSTVEKMQLEAPGIDFQAEHPSFVDYWIAQPGQKGVKTDWDATWRNWMRRVAKESTGRKSGPQNAAQRAAQLVGTFGNDQPALEADGWT
jgi:hypothetical protein